MRIMQISSMPIRQNTMNFRGGQASLLEQLSHAHINLENKGLKEEAEKVYQAAIDEASQRLLGGSRAPEDVKALEVAGLSYARNLMQVLVDKKNPAKANEAFQKISNASLALSGVGLNTRGLDIKNPIPSALLQLVNCGLLTHIKGL